MSRFTAFATVALFSLFILAACSAGDPVTPTSGIDLNPQAQVESSPSQTHLWGWYDCTLDLENNTVVAYPDRASMFTANVTNFINNNPLSLKFSINDTPIGPDYIDVDIDVAITHPFPGMPQYNGYDVRGIFMADGSANLDYDSDLEYPVFGNDQFMMDNPDTGVGGPDGYTRWFNATEFPAGQGMPLFSYTPGNIASPGFSPTATLCPYKYFANSLGTDEYLWDFLGDNADLDGVFTSGATNERNYYLRFPNAKGVRYGYAVVANWEGNEPEFHPSNAPEAIACDIEDNSNLWYVNPSDNGGSLDIEFSLFGWHSQPDAITIESTVLSLPENFDPATIATGGSDHVSTYHVEILADSISGTDGNELWIIAEYENLDYNNDFGTPNLTGDDPLAAFFRHDLDVGDEPGNSDPVCDIIVVTEMPAEGWTTVPVEFDASGSYDPDGDTLSYEWDFNGNGVFSEDPEDSIDEGTDINPVHFYTSDYTGIVSLRLSDTNGGISVCSTDPIDVTLINCPDTNTPSGGPSPNIYTAYGSAASAGMARGFGDSEEFMIGYIRDYYGQRWGFYAIDGNATNPYYYLLPAQSSYPPTVWSLAGTSTGRIYIHTMTQYLWTDDVLYYVDFDESATDGFTNIFQQASMPSVLPWHFVRITVDENDYPVGLCYQNNDLAIKHWNGSSWDHIDIDDSLDIYDATGYYRNGVQDFAFHPVSDTYWIANRYHGYTPNYDGVPTIYCINSDGTTAWFDDEIYPNVPDYTQYSVGIEIDMLDPDCRTLVLISCGSTGTNDFGAMFIRYDPFGVSTGSGYLADSAITFEMAHGTVFTYGGTTRYGGSSDFGGSWTSLIAIPDW